jgi:phosphate transport system permease protein
VTGATQATPRPSSALAGQRRGVVDRLGDRALYLITLAAALLSVAVVLGLAYKILSEASDALSKFGAGFLTKSDFDPVHASFGAAQFLFGTAVSSFGALLIATPVSIAIALFLTELAPRASRTAISTLIELLAGIPSVILGLWGIIVLGPVLQKHVEPALHSVFGWIPVVGNLFGSEYSLVGLFPAIVILTIMTVPIVSSLTREIFATAPPTVKEGALALGATRWEMIKTVVLPYSRPGIIAAVILGLGRAVGEAIAVTQVIGNSAGIHANLFLPADSLASRIANTYQGASTALTVSSLAYFAVILFVLSLIFNTVARLLVRSVEGRARRAG